MAGVASVAALVVLAAIVPILGAQVPSGPSGARATVLGAPDRASPAGETSASSSDLPSSSPQATATSPHPGILQIYDVLPGGATTVDPANAYDTASAEPILNVYETLITYNGSSTGTFVPLAATCVPGSAACVTDYGSNLTAGPYVLGTPTAWTFVLDPAARFYDPATGANWSVYPTDVFFSIARTLAFGQVQDGLSNSAGWILSQALLPDETHPTWDNGNHPIWNNTPYYILSSMLVNSSAYCPTPAMDGVHGNGCITFLANGSGRLWPSFLQFVADALGAAVVPCGWFTFEGAGVPGFSSSAARGDGSCALPSGDTTTDAPSWGTYLLNARLAPTSWDPYESAANSWPHVQPHVSSEMLGSGPYYGAVTGGPLPGGAGYQLAANPAYHQPSACSGAVGFAQYAGYCDPAPGEYIPRVNVYYEPDDTAGINAYNASQADFAEISHWGTLRSLANGSKLDYEVFPSLRTFFSPIDLAFNETTWHTDFPSQPAQTIPSDFFTNPGLRQFYTSAYPYSDVERTQWTVHGVPLTFNSCGPIPFGLNGASGSYYPTNLTCPGGDPYHPTVPGPDHNSSHVGGTAWWWSQVVNNTSSVYYNTTAAACDAASPCTWAIVALPGDPADSFAINEWISGIEQITGDALQPFLFTLPPSLPFDFWTSVNDAGENPFVSATGLYGWTADYPDPADYVQPIVQPFERFTEPYAWGEQLLDGNPALENNTSCGHSTPTNANLTYWAHAAVGIAGGTIAQACQGVAYSVAAGAMTTAALLADGPERVVEYNLIEQITNALAMYVWQGQGNAVVSAAPWINLSTANSNPQVGGGGDNLWFHIACYVGCDTLVGNSPVTFKGVGVPAGTTWGVSIAGRLSSTTQPSKGPGSVVLTQPNGTLTFNVAAPAGYGLAKVTGKSSPTYYTVNVSGATNIVLHFGLLTKVYFNETNVSAWTGLPAGSHWNVTLTPKGKGQNPTVLYKDTTGSFVNWTLPKGAHYLFKIGHRADYKAAPFKGAVGVGAHTLVKKIKFKPITATIKFQDTNFTKGTFWYVNLTGPMNLSLSGTTSKLKTKLINGTYSYSAQVKGGAIITGSIVVVAPTGQIIALALTPSHAVVAPMMSPLYMAPAPSVRLGK